ncbi:thiopeptide-type bacteriocin biosynthesis protein [Mucilaginibacter sp. SG538B]|uniref:lantibiotic dehydratase n=1 Tax=Mucilaginibacter sp. SG538B TaxID=2587021 RepID=UPI00159DDFAA|nr:lantibiotic dehydratase [Mucilaginibacter sp. SG538B]NVM66898.1 thiopeptide-type bacteriocin biosynthesis protein [Mucilaginibacter sp. SG538B]
MVNPEHIEFLDKVFVRRPYFDAAGYKVGKLQEVLKTNVFKNAIWLASTEFYKELEKKGFEYDLLNPKERLTALKFYNRMTFRATPFGAFSEFSLADWAEGGKKAGGRVQNAVLHLLPSVQSELDALDMLPPKDDTLIAINPTLYAVGHDWRFTKYDTEKSGRLSFYVYMLQRNEVDALLLKYLKSNSQPKAKIIAYLKELTDCTDNDASAHVNGLLDEQVLVSEHGLNLLTGNSDGKKISLNFDEDSNMLISCDQALAGTGNLVDGSSIYSGLEIKELSSVSTEWQEVIRDAMAVLDLLAPISSKNDLITFKEAFEKKFGERSVPLLEALDPDLGVAYGNAQQAGVNGLIQGLEFAQPRKQSDQIQWTAVHQLLLKVWLQNGKRNEWEPVVLTDADLSALKPSGLPLPPSTSVICSVAGDKLIYQNIGGSTATALTGRFSAFSDDFMTFCRHVASQEAAANPDIIFAELLQVSHRKIDNINRRQQVYDAVLPLNTFPVNGSILPADLELSMQGGDLMLVHRPSGKRVIPRLPTAFNFHHNGMPLFKFLCALQYQSTRANLDFDPEKLFPGLNFYPRISYGKSILSQARWHISTEEVKVLTQQPLSISRLHLFCRQLGIPVKVSTGRSDQQLFFDLSNDAEALFFLENLRGAGEAVVTEFLGCTGPGEKNADQYNTQLVISLLNRAKVYQPVHNKFSRETIARDFQPGSEWVYMKIYATYESAENILLNTLVPWIADNHYRISQWFFVRYFDTDAHLRIRLKVDIEDVKQMQFDLQGLIGNLTVRGLAQKAYFDTYQREIERYSADLICQVEEVFFRGSEFVCQSLLNKPGSGNDGFMLWPVRHCYQMLLVFYRNDLEKAMAVCQWVSHAFFMEHDGDKKLKRSMDDRYREIRAALLYDEKQSFGDWELITHLNASLSDLSNASAGKPEPFRQKLIADIIHMQVNRIFKSEQRRHETFIWHCLLKMFVSAVKSGVKVGEGASVTMVGDV